MKIKSYNPLNQNSGANVFFIQNKGYNAGKPLKNPIANCWIIESKNPIAFEICYMVFSSKILHSLIIGSVIPFIRLEEYKKIMIPILENPFFNNETIKAKILQIRNFDTLIQNIEKQKTLLNEMKKTISNELLKKAS